MRARTRTRRHTVRVEYTLPRAAASAGRARELTTAFLARPHSRAAVFDQRRVHEATLVVSELVANATEHGRSGCRLRLAVSADRVIVEVDDDNPDRPQVRSGEDLAERGRGLAIVRHLSDSLEFIGAGEGKTVRAVLAG